MIQKYLVFVPGSFVFTFNYFVRSSFPFIEYGAHFHSSLPQSLGVTLSSYLCFQWCIPCSSLFGFIYYLKSNYIQQQELRQFVSGHRLTVLSEMQEPAGFSAQPINYFVLLLFLLRPPHCHLCLPVCWVKGFFRCLSRCIVSCEIVTQLLVRYNELLVRYT